MKLPLTKAAITIMAAAALVLTAPDAQAQTAAPLTVNWYHGAEVLTPVINEFERATGIDVTVTDDYDTFNTDVILVSDYQTLTAGKKIGRFHLLSQHTFKYPVRSDVRPSAFLQAQGAFIVDQTDLNDLEFYYDRVDALYRELGWPQNW